MIRDFVAFLEAGFPKILARDAVLGKKTLSGIEMHMTEVRDEGL